MLICMALSLSCCITEHLIRKSPGINLRFVVFYARHTILMYHDLRTLVTVEGDYLYECPFKRGWQVPGRHLGTLSSGGGGGIIFLFVII